ncbi:MAG: rhodanese-like domain-containing protein [Bacteroidota bacterium]|nr:rhodanese-like domain-containing protein [Bacteroidota bacterium]
MNKTYYFLIALTFALGVGALFLPEKLYTKEISPEQLFYKMNNPSRFVTTDQVARLIIESDPTLLLIDTRSSGQYRSFSLPRAMNIPLEELLDSNGIICSKWIDYLNIEGMKVVFFSNSDVTADQVWVVCTRHELENLYVMRGGLNTWTETILRPQKPSASSPIEEFALYDFRRGACQYFGGGSISLKSDVVADPVPRIRRKKKTVVAGGC